MPVSILVATFNRAWCLRESLAALARQRFEEGDEIIVVDNGSTDGTFALLEEAKEQFPARFVALREPRPGKSTALARGLSNARGEVLAFADDDVLVGRDWLPEVRRALAEPSVSLVGGRVWPWWRDGVRLPRWLRLQEDDGRFGPLAAPLALMDYGNASADLGPRTAPGGNSAIRRSVLEAVGGFRADLGKQPKTLLSGEDHELTSRVQAAGYRAVYDPALVVYHLVPADRLRVGYYLRWFYWSGVTNAAIARLQGERDGRRPRTVLGVPGFVLRRAPRSMASGLAAIARGRAPEAVRSATELAFGAGYAAYAIGWTARTRRRDAVRAEVAA